MAAITVATALTEMRALLRDTNSAAPAFTDAQGMSLLNLGLLWWSENMERRTRRYTRSSPITFTGAVTEWTAGAPTMDTNFTSDVAEFLEVGLDAEAYTGGTGSTYPLERIGWTEMRQRQFSASTGRPTHWAAFKHNGSHVWTIGLYPLANLESEGPDVGWKLVGLVRVQPTLLTLTTDKIDLGDSETRSNILLASILMAPLMNRGDLAGVFKNLLPERVREKMESTPLHDEVNA